MSDGSWGYTAKQGLEAVMNGTNIEAMNNREGAMTLSEMYHYLLQGHDEDDYSEAARQFGGVILRLMEEDHSLAGASASDVDWFVLARERGLKFDDSITGFMFGWAVNAARYARGTEIGPNPAILRIG